MKKKKIIFNKKTYKNDIKNLLNWFLKNYGSIRTNKLVDKLKIIGFNTATEFGLSLGLEDLKPPETKSRILKNTINIIQKEKKKLINGKINIIQYAEKKNEVWNKANNAVTLEITKKFEETNSLNPAYMMIISGARGNLSQIKQLVGMRGLMADAEGEIINTPIKNNLKEGINLYEYFISCYGARKGIIDTALKTANSGYLTRKLIYAAQAQIIKKSNCNTKHKSIIKNIKISKQYYEKIKKNIVGRVLAKNTTIKIKQKEIILTIGQDICGYLIKKLALVKEIYIRTPLTCIMNTGICQLCYGWNLGNGRMVELGESVGIIAGQSIGEPGTQLTMRTFHTGGIINIKTKETILTPCAGKLSYKLNGKGKIIETKNKEKGIITLSKTKISILPLKGNKITLNIPKHTIIFIKNKGKVHNKQIICETSNLRSLKNLGEKKINKIITIKSNISGIIQKKKLNKKNRSYIKITIGNIVNYINLTKVISDKKKLKIKLTYQLKKKKKKNNRNLYKYKTKNINIKICNLIKLSQEKKNKLLISKKKIYILKKKSKKKKLILINKIKSKITIRKKEKKFLGKIKNIKYNYKQKKTELISSQIYEKRINYLTFIKTNIHILKTNEKIFFLNNELIKKQHPIINITYLKRKIKDIAEGLPKIQQIFESNKKQKLNEKLKKLFLNLKKKYTTKVAAKKSFSLIQIYILKKIKDVYSKQGININEKHFEILIKQMTSKVIIIKTGASKLLNGEIIPLTKVNKINKNIKDKANYEPIVLGISKVIKLNEGFLCSASFQETTNIISKAAIEGRIDWLNGLKENIILGNLIPVGTGNKKTQI